MRLLTSLLFFLGIGSWGLVFAGTTDPNTPDAKYVEFGKQFPGIVKLWAKAPCKNPECPKKVHDQFGSAVVIRPNWILTAAHVLEDTYEQRVVTDAGKEYPLAHVILHSEYRHARVGFHDIALGYMPDALKLDFYTPLYADQDEVGKAVTISGFGMHGTFLTGSTLGDDQRRGGHNVIDSAEPAIIVCSASRGSSRLPLEFLIASGDSGGGLFIGNKLAGINSFLMAVDNKPDGTYGDEAAFTRVSSYADWVEQQIDKHELALQYRSTMAPDVRPVADTGETP